MMCLIFLLGVLLSAFQSQAAPSFTIDHAQSYLVAITGKTGMFSFAAHQHAIIAGEWTADVTMDPTDRRRSSVAIHIPARSLVIDSEDGRRLAKLSGGPSASDVKTLQQRMLSAEVLDAERFLAIEFRSTAVEPADNGYRLQGQLILHGQTHNIVVPIKVTGAANGGTRASSYDGSFVIRQTWFGMKPETVAGGTVKVKDEIEVRFHIVTR